MSTLAILIEANKEIYFTILFVLLLFAVGYIVLQLVLATIEFFVRLISRAWKEGQDLCEEQKKLN